MDIKVTGADEFADLSRALKAAGDKGMQRELAKAMNRVTKPLTLGVKASVADYVPSAYAAVLAPSLRVTTRRSASARGAGVRLTAKASTGRGKPRELSRLDAGVLRHPGWGNRRFWYSQPVRPGFYTRELEQGAPRVRRELVEAIRTVAAQIDRAV